MLLARVAVCAVFLLDGAVYGSWAAQVPALARQAHAGNAVLGLVLLGPAAAMVLTAVPAGRACARFGPRAVTAVCLGLGFVVLALVGTAGSALRLGLTLAVLGGLMGMVDVAANVAGVAVVRALDRPLMPLFHAHFSIGGLVGAGGAALGAAAGAGTTTQLAAVAGAGLLTLTVVTRWLPDERPPAREDRHPRRSAVSGDDRSVGVGDGRGAVAGDRRRAVAGDRRHAVAGDRRGAVAGDRRRAVAGDRRLWAVAAGAVLVAVAEGACSEWSGIFLVQQHETADVVGVGGYALFTAVVAATRLGGERLERLLGAHLLVGGGALLAAAGLLLTATAPAASVAIAGLGLAGAGLACAFPVLIGLAGRAGEARDRDGDGDGDRGGREDGRGGEGAEVGRGGGEREIAFVTTVAYAGMLAGPPLIGWTAGVAGLPLAMGTVAVACLAVAPAAWIARRTAPETKPARSPAAT
ncbi:MFS transporter [Streptomyces sp. NPDC088387]|uniref:MFS transporter n=1 Tax=Streptomyces sp. NPDC088387 TaxID=3365859 RepID=UPI0037FFC6D0